MHEASDDRRLFVRVVESGSLKAAAEHFGTDPSTVSRRIARLETRLQVRLLRRSTRRSTPTDAGAQLYEGLKSLLADLDALEARVAREVDEPRGRLRVAAPADFGARFVVPVLNALRTEHPGLTVEVRLGSGYVELEDEGIDVAVRIGRLPDSSLRVRRLGFVPRVLVASPDYLLRTGTPSRAEDLASMPFVLYNPGHGTRFEIIGPSGVPFEVRAPASFAVNSVSAIVELVEAGHGAHLGPRWAFAQGLAAGRLVELLPDHELPKYPLNAVFVPGRWQPARVRVFLDRLAETLPGQLSG